MSEQTGSTVSSVRRTATSVSRVRQTATSVSRVRQTIRVELDNRYKSSRVRRQL